MIENWQQYVAIAAEAFFALLGIILSVFQYIKRLRSKGEANSLLQLVLSVPRAILEAELTFGDEHGDEKKEYSLLLLQKYCTALSLDFSKYEQICRDLIEDSLLTPQKKL